MTNEYLKYIAAKIELALYDLEQIIGLNETDVKYRTKCYVDLWKLLQEVKHEIEINE